MVYKYLKLLVVGFWLTTCGFAADARFTGMGNLSYLFQDDYYRLDLYDFAGISSGFFRNDTVPYAGLRGSVLREDWEQDSTVYWAVGQAVPDRLQDYAPVEALGYYEDIPVFQTIPWEFIYISRRKESKYDYFGGELPRQAWGFWAGYSRLSRAVGEETEAISTPALNLIYSRPVSNRFDFGVTFDAFYGSYSSPGGTYGAALVPVGGGLGLSYNNARLDVGLNTEYHYLNFSFDTPSTVDESFSGHAISPALGLVLKIAGLTWANALDYKWTGLDGSYDGNDMGDLKITGYAAKTQMLYALKMLRVTVFGEFDQQTPVYTDQSDAIDFETSYQDYMFGGGIGLAYGPAIVGVEGFMRNVSAEDRVIDQTVEGSQKGAKIGLEVWPVRQIALRAGFDYLMVDPDIDFDADDEKTNTITCGLGLNTGGTMRFDIGYNYKNIELEMYPDETIKDHVVVLYFKKLITEEGF